MTSSDLLMTALLSMAPISELRGAIPYAIIKNANPVFAYFYCVFFNSLIAPLFYLFILTIHKLLLRLQWYSGFFEKFIMKARDKVKNGVEKYGYFGIMLFVAIPFPLTGAYTGTAGAWVLGLGKRKTILAVTAGVAIAGLIVSLVLYFGVETFSFFTKKVSV